MYQLPADVQEIVKQRLATGKYASEDEVLRDALRALADEDEDVAAVQEAIAGWQAGEMGVPLDLAFDHVREQYRAGDDP